jgi:hypothetical protein
MKRIALPGITARRLRKKHNHQLCSKAANRLADCVQYSFAIDMALHHLPSSP